MSKSFSAKNILLGSGLLSSTGNVLYLNGITVNGSASGINSLNNLTGNANLTGVGNITVSVSNQLITVSGDTGVYANFATTANLALTGQQVWTAANNNSINLSGNLTQTGIILMSLISAASAGVSSLNGASGVVNIAGAGTVNITTSGQSITVSGRPVNASGEITGLFSSVYFNTGAVTGFLNAGELHWNPSLGTLDLGLIDNNTLVSHLGQNSISYVQNVDTGTIFKGQAVYLFGAQGDKPTVRLASNTGESTSSKTLGLMMEDTLVNNLGYVKDFGVIENLNLSTYNPGDALWLGSSPGSYTTDKPMAPSHAVFLGVVTRSNAGNGQAYIKVQNGYELDEIHNVRITGVANGQILYYNSTTGVWYNANFDHSDGLNLSGNLTQTGVTLGAKIDSLSGFIGNVSGGLETRIAATGNAAIAQANSIGQTISGNLGATGSNLYVLITGLSGQAVIDYATKTQLTNTGATLDSKINSLSGFIGNVSGGLEVRITATGNSTVSHANGIGANLSGNLQSTGSNLQTQINNITNGTGNILTNVVFTTGLQYIVGTKYFIGNTYIDNLFVTGSQTVINTQDLYVADNWITLNATGGARDSAIFVSTGFTGALSTGGILGFDVPSNTWRFGLGSQQTDLVTLPTIASGEAVTAVDSRVTLLSGFTTNLSGAIDTRLIATGNAAITHANGIGSTISGNLIVTGSTLDSKINSLSGFVGNVSGGLEARIFITGNTLISYVNGIGSIISGNLTQTGVTLGGKIDSLSGYSNSNFITTGSLLAYTTGIITGSDQVYINHLNYAFATIPKVVVELEVSNSIYSYMHLISGKSNTGFYLLFSEIIAETGIFANIIAKT